MEFFEAKNMEQLVNLISKNKVNVVEFFSDTCAPCHQLEKIVRENVMPKLQYPNCVGFLKVNIDTFKDLAEDFAVLSVPTVMFYFCGNRVIFDADAKKMDRIQGLIPNIGPVILNFVNTLSEMPSTGESCPSCGNCEKNCQ
jgi:thioredoxin-like negative regulator of GroEL